MLRIAWPGAPLMFACENTALIGSLESMPSVWVNTPPPPGAFQVSSQKLVCSQLPPIEILCRPLSQLTLSESWNTGLLRMKGV